MIKKNNSGLLCLLTAMYLATGVKAAHAAPPDASYIAYATIPGPMRGVPGFHLLVSMDKCPAKGAPANWKRGKYLYKNDEEAACWVLDGQNVKFCPLGQYETTYSGTTVISCHVWPENKFYSKK